MPRRAILILAGLCMGLAAAIAVGTVVVVSQREANAPGGLMSEGQPSVGGPFRLIDFNGQPVDETMLQGKWSLVFFGFTYCPDYCPMTLGTLAAVQNRLKETMGDRADAVQIIFISVDPERDTPQLLKDYLSSDGFPEGAIGLTGTPEQVAEAARVYRAYYERVETRDSYTMNHGLTVYLMGPDGKFRLPLSHDLGPDRTATIIADAMRRG